MNKRKWIRFKKRVENFLFDHYILKAILDYLVGFFIAAIAALIFGFGFSCFISPANEGDFVLATGGVAGLTQIIALLIKIITGRVFAGNLVQSVGYTVFNIPLIIFSFFKIGKRFTIFTLVNVVLTSVFISLISNSGMAKEVMNFNFSGGETTMVTPLMRVLFAGICSGLASATAFAGGISCGGVDIVSYYVGVKKSAQVGRYNIIFNVVLVTTYALLKLLDGETTLVYSLYSVIFSILYIMIAGLIIDAINLRNKKIELQIVTEKEHMPEIMIANFPHSATITEGKGAYSGARKLMLWMVVSSSEVKRVVNVARKIDENAFIAVTPLKQVYGNFFIKPTE